MSSSQPIDPSCLDKLVSLCDQRKKLEKTPVEKLYFTVSKQAGESVPSVGLKEKSWTWGWKQLFSIIRYRQVTAEYNKVRWKEAIAKIVQGAVAEEYSEANPEATQKKLEALTAFKSDYEAIFPTKPKGLFQKFLDLFWKAPKARPAKTYSTVKELSNLIDKLKVGKEQAEQARALEQQKSATLDQLHSLLDRIGKIASLECVRAKLEGHRNIIRVRKSCEKSDITEAGQSITEANAILGIYEEVTTAREVIGKQLQSEMDADERKRLEKRFEQTDFSKVRTPDFDKISKQLSEIKKDLEAIRQEVSAAVEKEQKRKLLGHIASLRKDIEEELLKLGSEASTYVTDPFLAIQASEQQPIDTLSDFVRELEGIKDKLSRSSEKKRILEELKGILKTPTVNDADLILMAIAGQDVAAKSLAIHLMSFDIVEDLMIEGKQLDATLGHYVEVLKNVPELTADEIGFLLKKSEQRDPKKVPILVQALAKQCSEKKVSPQLKEAPTPYYQLVFLTHQDPLERMKAAVMWLQKDFKNQQAIEALTNAIQRYPKAQFGDVLAFLSCMLLPAQKDLVKPVLADALRLISGADRETLRKILYKDASSARELALEASGIAFTDLTSGLTESSSRGMELIRSEATPFESNDARIASYTQTLCLALSQLKEKGQGPIHLLFLGQVDGFTVNEETEFRSLLGSLAKLSVAYPGVTFVAGGIAYNGKNRCPVFEDGRLIAVAGDAKSAQNYFLLPNGVSVALGIGDEALQQAREAQKLLPVKGKGPDLQICLGPGKGKRIVAQEEGYFISPEVGLPTLQAVREETKHIPFEATNPFTDEDWARMGAAVESFRTGQELAFASDADWEAFSAVVREKNIQTLMTSYRRPFLELLSSSTKRSIVLYTDSPGYPLEMIGSGTTPLLLMYSFQHSQFSSLDTLRQTQTYIDAVASLTQSLAVSSNLLEALGKKAMNMDLKAFRSTRMDLLLLQDIVRTRMSAQPETIRASLACIDKSSDVESELRKVDTVLAFADLQTQYLGMDNPTAAIEQSVVEAMNRMGSELGQELAQKISAPFRADKFIAVLVSMAENRSWKQFTLGSNMLPALEGGIFASQKVPDEATMATFLDGLMVPLAFLASTRPDDAQAARSGLQDLRKRYATSKEICRKIDEIIRYFS